MELDDKIYIAGHKGLVGSAILRQLKAKGFKNLLTILHNNLDLTNQDLVLKRIGSSSLYCMHKIENIVGKKINREVRMDQPIFKRYIK